MAASLGIDYTRFTSPEHVSWKAHRELLLAVPSRGDVGWRGCFGLAMLVDNVHAHSWEQAGLQTLAADRSIRWASIVDIPAGYFALGARGRELHWATVRPTTIKFGMPTLDRGTEVGTGGRHAWDYRMFPFHEAVVTNIARESPFAGEQRTYETTIKASSPDVFDPERQVQLFRCLNAIEWAMTAAAVAFRRGWKAVRPAMLAALGAPSDLSTEVFSYGSGFYTGLPRPATWMPRPYIAFPAEARDQVFDKAVHPLGRTDYLEDDRYYAEGLCAAFVEALGDRLAFRAPFSGQVVDAHVSPYGELRVPATWMVLKDESGRLTRVPFFQTSVDIKVRRGRRFEAGDVLAEEKLDCRLPGSWDSLPAMRRWREYARKLLGNRLSPVMRLWFDRQALTILPGTVHFPAQIASVASARLALREHLYWDVTRCLEYFRDDCDAIVFPPVRQNNWHNLAGMLPGDIAYDLHPADSRYRGQDV